MLFFLVLYVINTHRPTTKENETRSKHQQPEMVKILLQTTMSKSRNPITYLNPLTHFKYLCPLESSTELGQASERLSNVTRMYSTSLYCRH